METPENMNIWKHRRFLVISVIDLWVVYAVLSVNHIGGLGGGSADALNPVVNAGERPPDPQGRLVFLLTTGFEDLREVELCLYDVKVAKSSGYLADVILIVQGRGVDLLTDRNGRPSQIADLAREVLASGVHIIASENALKEYGLSSAHMDPQPSELVPDAALRMTEFVSQGYQVIRY
jgi:hypothetical protein